MKTRNEEKCAVNFVNTNQLNTGSIISVQNYLNEDEQKTEKESVANRFIVHWRIKFIYLI